MNASVTVVPLGDLCHVVGGGTPPKDRPEYYSGDIPWATVRDMRSEVIEKTEFKITRAAVAASATSVIPAGNVVIATRVGLGKVCLIEHPTAINQDLRGVIPRDPQRLTVKYLFWWLKSVAHLIEKEGTGATVQGVKLPFVKSLGVPLHSLEEQRRIVAILDEAFEGIATAKANAEKNLQNARELCEELMQVMFPEDSFVGSDPPTLDSLCELIVDCEHKTAPTQEDGIPSIRTPNIGKGRLLLEGVYRVSEATYQEWTRRAEPRGGDLILAREAPAGNVAVIPDGMKVCLGQRTVLIRPKTALLEPDYLAQLLLRQNSQRRLLAHSRGATVQHINMKDIRAFRIAAVPTLVEQRHVVDRVNDLFEIEDRLVVAYGRKLAALAELKKSLLHQAFSGQL